MPAAPKYFLKYKSIYYGQAHQSKGDTYETSHEAHGSAGPTAHCACHVVSIKNDGFKSQRPILSFRAKLYGRPCSAKSCIARRRVSVQFDMAGDHRQGCLIGQYRARNTERGASNTVPPLATDECISHRWSGRAPRNSTRIGRHRRSA